MSSLPVPVSPWMSTVLRVAATRATISNTSRIAGEAPTIRGARQPGRTAGRSPAGPGLARDSCLSNCSLAAPESTS